MTPERKSGHTNPVVIHERPNRGTPEWEEEQRQSNKSVKHYFEDVVGPTNPDGETNIQLQFTHGALLEQAPTEDEQPIIDVSGLFPTTRG